MVWWLFLLAIPAFAIPSRDHRDHIPPNAHISFKTISESGSDLGAIQKGSRLFRVSDNKIFVIHRPLYIRYYKQQDEQGYKYIIENDGKTTYKVAGDLVEPIKDELLLYEPPTRFTPAPIIVKKDFDKKFGMAPEITFLTGSVTGNYMEDLFNDKKARSGQTNQFGIHLVTNWKLPLKVGAVLHYEKSVYDLSNDASLTYTAYSIGPQFKTMDFDWIIPMRFQTQYRVSPFAKARAEASNGSLDFKFNSADLLTSAEVPIENRFGEFVLGIFYQAQWLNLKDQPDVVSLKASNQTNTSIGISFAQVFQ